MSDVVIRAEGLGKRYLIGHQSQNRERYTALRDVLGRGAKNLGRTALDMMRGRQIVVGDEVEEFWALKDVSFEIKRGEVVGIIGRNGAGKSTLLKVLSRITEPSEGRVTIVGRVASLLEVGTGFHPELSGRENIYLNGAILGMSRAEIASKFDEIVDFSGVEKFLDTPVKRYSSGMYVRLAFAVAAHLDPEILIVDEVLAVGDAEFQRKCLGKMQDVAGHGRTVLFVSHNMGAIERLTETALLLESGKSVFLGPTQKAVSRYASRPNSTAGGWQDVRNISRHYGNGKVIARQARATYHHGEGIALSSVNIDVEIEVIRPVDRIRLSFTICKQDSVPVGSGFSDHVELRQPVADTLLLSAIIPQVSLAPGEYTVGFSIGEGDAASGNIDYDVVLDAISFEIASAHISGSPIQTWPASWGAVLYPNVRLRMKKSIDTIGLDFYAN